MHLVVIKMLVLSVCPAITTGYRRIGGIRRPVHPSTPAKTDSEILEKSL